VESLDSLARDPDNAAFSGLYSDNDRSAADFLATLNLRYLESYVNRLLQEIVTEQNGRFEEELKENKEQTHYLLDNISVEVLTDRRIFLKIKASTVKKKKTFLNWFRSQKWKIERDSYGISAELGLYHRNLKDADLRSDRLPIYYHHEAIGIEPHKVKIEFGQPSLVNRALSLLTDLDLDAPIGSLVKRLLLKVLSSYFNSQYDRKPGETSLGGHEIETIVKVLTTRSEILLLLNPRLMGPALELKLTGGDRFLERAIKIDPAKQAMHLAFTASGVVAKLDKRDLVSLIEDADRLIAPYLQQRDGTKLAQALNRDLVVDKAVRATDPGKMSLYHRLLTVMRRYDAVLNSVNIPNPNRNAEKRISSCGLELMYFAGASYALYQQLTELTGRIESLGIQRQVQHYAALQEARRNLYHQIFLPLVRKYQEGPRAVSAQVVRSPAMYWTFQYYPDALSGGDDLPDPGGEAGIVSR
jgi:hypothetical protein